MPLSSSTNDAPIELGAGDTPLGSTPKGSFIEAGIGRMIADRFLLQQAIGESQGTRTFLARDIRLGDHKGGHDVVVKMIPESALTPGALMRLQYEANLLQRVDSRWFPRVLHAGREQNCFWLISHYVSGCSIKQRLAGGHFSIDDTLAVRRTIFSALRDLHEQKILHRSVRPANIITNRQGPISAATLIDFGPIQTLEYDGPLRNRAVGSRSLCFTRTSRFHRARPDRGLRFVLCGHRPLPLPRWRTPFNGDTVGTILFEHMTAPVPALSAPGESIPRSLEALIQRLLKKDPRDRYQSAEAALADLESIAEAMSAGDADPPVVIGARDKRCTLTDPSFVGRHEQVRSLDLAVASARAGAGGLVLLECESGGGKTRLLDETARRAAREGFWVLRGQGTSNVAQHPFNLLDGIVDGVLAAVRRPPNSPTSCANAWANTWSRSLPRCPRYRASSTIEPPKCRPQKKPARPARFKR